MCPTDKESNLAAKERIPSDLIWRGNPFASYSGDFWLKWRHGVETVTPAGENFFRRHVALLDLILFQVYTSGRVDELEAALLRVIEAFNAIVISQKIQDSEAVPIEPLRSGLSEAKTQLASHFPLLQEMLFCEHVDAFQVYLAELLSLVMRARPEVLKSREMIAVEDVLSCSSMDEVLARIAESHVARVSRGGFLEVASYLNGMKISIGSAEEVSRLAALVEARNLLTHKQGAIDQKFAIRFPDLGGVGGNLRAYFTGMLSAIGELLKAVERIDGAVADKFSLERNKPNVYYRFRAGVQLKGLEKS